MSLLYVRALMMEFSGKEGADAGALIFDTACHARAVVELKHGGKASL